MADNNEIKAINKTGFAQRLREYKRKPLSLVLFILVVLAAAISVLALVFLIVYILVMGVPHITPELFAWEYNSDNVSCMPAIINTVVVTLLTLIIAVPFGVGAAIYLAEYAKRGNKFVKLIRTMAETLSGIPSIVYGLFGMLFFVTTLQWRLSLLAGSFYTCNYGITDNYENYRGSFAFCSRLVPRGQLRTWRRQAENNYKNNSSECNAGYSCRYNSCSRQNSRRNCGSFIYIGFGIGSCKRSYVFGQNACYSYVCTCKRGIAYRSGLGNSGCIACACTFNKYAFGIYRQKAYK